MASDGASGEKGIHFSAREMEILVKTWQCFDETPKINWKKLAELAKFKNVKTAQSCFQPIKKKLALAPCTASSQGDSGAPSTPTKGRGKRKAGSEKTPGSGKKAKVSIPNKAISSIEEEADRDDDDKIHAQIKAELNQDKDYAEDEA
ncbi:hypothetical protein GGR54DRAFT_440471 [Hypoxylon sp. NC1633]|nr:hypothetical protein GGR54DRAFT_440471 [Hypoxylon sp. NC1633]